MGAELKKLSSFWNKAFLEERPSIGLSFFRIFVAFTVGAHIIPTLLHLDDNYLHTAFREKNTSFFTPLVLALVEKSPDGFVLFMTALFYAALFLFAVGLFSQLSCILMAVGCYYFYALNSLHIGTLSYDILLVTLFLMCITNYHGDFFGLDSLRRPDPFAYRKKRPFFVQRLLQLQIASTYFYTALCKFTVDGNWFTGNPIYHLLNSVPQSVVKHFPLRNFFAASPELCKLIGIVMIFCELSLPFLLFIKRTRVFAIIAGFLFHVMLVVTLHVPTIFFFLFPPQLLLFIDPEDIVAWIEKRRAANEKNGRDKIIYDGHCVFCRGSLARLLTLDFTGKLEPVDYQPFENPSELHPKLTREICHSRMQLVTKDGKLYGGFYAFQNLTLKLPLLMPLAPLVFFPGVNLIGEKAYDLIAKNRYLFHSKAACKDNRCFR